MNALKGCLRHARLLPVAALAGVLLLLAFDTAAFWGWHLRPLASVDGMEIAVWAVLWGTALAPALRWMVLRESRMRFQVAAALGVMIAFSVLHPWHNGYAVPAEMPIRAAGDRTVPPDAVVKFEGGPLTPASPERW